MTAITSFFTFYYRGGVGILVKIAVNFKAGVNDDAYHSIHKMSTQLDVLNWAYRSGAMP